MKRHPGLVPLSHDHHDTLVIAQGLIRGHSSAPRSDWPRERRAQLDRVVTFFAHTLQPHFEAEETWVFPTAAKSLTRGDTLIEDLLAEHEQIRALVSDLQHDPADDLETRLPALGHLLVSHVRTEERVLFETMQREMPSAALDAIGARLATLPRRGPSCGLPRRPAADG